MLFRAIIKLEYEEKTSFITNQGTYCCKDMSFGLKNTEATYQRLVSKIFMEKVERNLEAYIDDMLVKSNEEANHIVDL